MAARLWCRIEYVAPAGAPLPLVAAGRYWMERTTHLVPPAIAATLLTRPHFAQVGTAPAPARPAICEGCRTMHQF